MNTRLISVLLLFFGLFLLPTAQAQNEIPPECTNLSSVMNKIGYPVEAKAARIEGKVIAKVVVSTRGRVESHEIVDSPNAILSDAVSAQIKGLKFRAAKKDGIPIKSIVHIPFLFELPEGPVQYNSVKEALGVDGDVEALDLSEQ
ncbi:MAG: energy transducer TonB, partial [Bacteroidota bacterium]